MRNLVKTGGRSSLTESEVIGMRRLYLAGAPINWIARMYRQDVVVIRNCVLFFTYANILNREPNRRRGTHNLTPEQIALARDTYERGADKDYAAAMLGVSTKRITEYLNA